MTAGDPARRYVDLARAFTFLLCMTGVYAATVASLPRWIHLLPQASNQGTTFVSVPLQVAFVAAACVFVMRSSISWAEVGWTRRGAKRSATEGTLCALALIGCAIVGKWVLVLTWPDLVGTRVFTTRALIAYHGLPQLMGFVGAYVVSTVMQEFVARGVVIGALRRLLPGSRAELSALGISAFLFAVTHAHLHPLWVPLSLILGGVWGAMFVRHETLVGVVVCHGLTGGVVFFMLAPV